MTEYKGLVAVITGANNGFGKEFVKQAAMRGMKIVAVDIESDFADLEKTAMECGAEEFSAVQADVGLYEETEKVVKYVMDKYGRIDLFINNAGIAQFGDILTMPVRDWLWHSDTNYHAHIYFMRQVIPIMIEQGTPCQILNVCSVAGLLTTRGMPAYYASKHAAVALSECMAYELEEKGIDNISISIFCPGFIQTTLDKSETRRPARYQAPDDPFYQSEAFKRSLAICKDVIETGKPIDGVGEYVFKAMENGDFYILYHPEHNPVILAQTQDVVTNGRPSLAGLKEKVMKIAQEMGIKAASGTGSVK